MQVLGRNEEEHRRRGSLAEGSSPNFAVFPGALARARVPGTAFSLLLPLGNPPSLLLEAAIGPADPLAPSPPLPRLSSSVSTVSHAPAPTFLRQQGAAQPRNSSLLVRLLFEHLPPAQRPAPSPVRLGRHGSRPPRASPTPSSERRRPQPQLEPAASACTQWILPPSLHTPCLPRPPQAVVFVVKLAGWAGGLCYPPPRAQSATSPSCHQLRLPKARGSIPPHSYQCPRPKNSPRSHQHAITSCHLSLFFCCSVAHLSFLLPHQDPGSSPLPLVL